MDDFIKKEQKKLYNEYKKKLSELKKIEKEKNAVGQVFTKGLLPIYVLFILSEHPTNGNDISRKVGIRTKGHWIPSTGGIYPILNKFEKDNLIEGVWIDNKKIYSLTDKGTKEFENKKSLLQNKIKDSLEVFKIIYSDLYL
ncbi:MAG: PadR family transcriptional regulator [Clostridiaceae bacterium]